LKNKDIFSEKDKNTYPIERFPVECRKTDNKEITLANHKGDQSSEPIRASSNGMKTNTSEAVLVFILIG